MRIDGIAISSGTTASAEPYTSARMTSAPTMPMAVSARTLGPPPPPPDDVCSCSMPVTSTLKPAGAAPRIAPGMRSMTPLPRGMSGFGMSMSAHVVRPSGETNFALWVFA